MFCDYVIMFNSIYSVYFNSELPRNLYKTDGVWKISKSRESNVKLTLELITFQIAACVGLPYEKNI